MGRQIHSGRYANELDYPGYAQEFLRRNPEYRKQYAETEASIADGASAALREVMALHWGLSFPLPSRYNRRRCTRNLVALGLTLHRRSRASAIGLRPC